MKAFARAEVSHEANQPSKVSARSRRGAGAAVARDARAAPSTRTVELDPALRDALLPERHRRLLATRRGRQRERLGPLADPRAARACEELPERPQQCLQLRALRRPRGAEPL